MKILHKLIVGAAIGAGAAWFNVACAEAAPVQTIAVAQGRQMASEGALLIDVREPDEYAEGHAPGSVLIPLGQLPSRLAEGLPGQAGGADLPFGPAFGARGGDLASGRFQQGVQHRGRHERVERGRPAGAQGGEITAFSPHPAGRSIKARLSAWLVVSIAPESDRDRH
jgi:hypothetical protein